MKNVLKKIDGYIFKRCPKTHRIQGVHYRQSAKWLFPILGLLSLLWFLIRVIPKPSRAGYPCMKVAAPMASGFLVYVGGLALSMFSFKKVKQHFHEHKFALVLAFIFLGFIGSLFVTGSNSTKALAEYYHEGFTPNAPIGEAKGIFPGRVVWVWDPDATNEACTNSSKTDDGWFMPKNNNQEVIDRMLSQAIQSLTGKTTDAEAWDAIFRFNNRLQGKGDVGYQEGQIIYFKVNATSAYAGNFDPKTLAVVKNGSYGITETNPHLVLAMLRQLVNVVGVNPLDIFIGDPLKTVYKHCYDLWTAEFPDITVLDNATSKLGRLKVVPTAEPVMKYSDRGTVMFTGDWSTPLTGEPTLEDRYCTIAEICDYLINIPTMKGHKRAGVTMFAKNHFGSQLRANAVHLHGGLVDPTEVGDYARFTRNQYRVQVDLMGHDLHYKKGLFYLMDALYAGSEATDPPRKFKMAPFNNDWASSIFLSLDPVAIESVGYDFLRTEYNEDSQYPYASKPAVDDYLHQAADKSEWPEGIIYDPEDDGTPIPSLGVHEHWNNASDKQYTRNLGTGDGIELVKLTAASAVHQQNDAAVESFALHQNYPNPFNPSTTIRFDLVHPADVLLEVVNVNGQVVRSIKGNYNEGSNQIVWNGLTDDGSKASTGVYFYRVTVDDGAQISQMSRQMVLLQ
jgi:hypothetical protein